MSEDPFSDPEGYVPPPPFVNSRLAEADKARRGGGVTGTSYEDDALARAVSGGIREYEGLRPLQGAVAAALRALPPRAADGLLRAWRALQRDPDARKRAGADEPPPVLVGLVMTELEPAVRADVDSKGEPRGCMLCGGTRWMRMSNHGPDPVEVEMERHNGSRFLAAVEKGDTYLIPCGNCSSGRKKKLDAARKGARTRRRTDREYVEEGGGL